MKISLSLLGDYIDWIEKDPQVIAQQVTAHTAEVDAIIQQGALLEHCCVGQVITISKHPDADKLVLCDVKTDKGKVRVVCGGTNLREGMCVAFAHVGATVRWHGEEMMTLEKVKIRGEESAGMICAAEELDLVAQFPEAVGHTIIDLGDDDSGVGRSLKEHLGLDDAVLDIDNHAITHRPDLFSHVGFARECVAMGIAKWKEEPKFELPSFGSSPLPLKLKNDAGKLIPRYLACTLSIDDVGETPDWMKSRLEAVGSRSLNLPVDITNYVMFELGMPLHSFDLDDLKGDISMRTAKKGEKIVTLDEAERVLPEGAIVISDGKGIFDLLGIMGGLRSSTKPTSRNLLLHSAVVDPVAIRNTIIATGHRTDAATIYEKGIPPVIAAWGFARALQLFLDHVPGAKITSKLETWGDDGNPTDVTVSLKHIHSLLGSDIPSKEITSALKNLGFSVESKKDKLSVKPPLWRIGDITGAHDVIEEVGRIYGYDKIDPQMPTAEVALPERDQRISKMRDAFKEQRFYEVLPLSLVGPSLLSRAAIEASGCAELTNPFGEELSLFQPSVLPGLLEHAEDTIRNAPAVLRTFTMTHVHSGGKEFMELGLLVASREETDLKSDPFLCAKADLVHALTKAGYSMSIQPAAQAPAHAHPGRCADIIIAGKTIGQLFEINPQVRAAFGLPQRASAALINIEALLAIESTETLAEPVSGFPPVVYDETIAMAHDKSVAKLLSAAREKSSLLESVEVADLFGKAEDKEYNLTLRFTYRSSERTLTEQEAKVEHEQVLGVVTR